MTLANTEMAAAWDGPEGEHWASFADYYEGTGDRLWERLQRRAPVRAGDVVLDVGCGTGKSTRKAARLAAPGRAMGVDLSSAMLATARERAAAEGIANVSFVQGDAQVHPFEQGAFDLALSSHGVMFFADPVAAFGNIRSALRPEGRLGFTAWRGLRENAWVSAFRDALAAGRQLPEPPPGAPGPFGLAEADHVRAVVGNAGFVDVELEAADEPLCFGKDADDAFSFFREMGITRGLTHDLDAQARAGVLEALRKVALDHETPQGVLLDSAAWVVTARNPTGG